MAVPPVIFGGNEPSICQNLLFIKEIFKGSSELASFAPHALKGQKPLAQGIALGNYGRKTVALQGQKLQRIRLG